MLPFLLFTRRASRTPHLQVHPGGNEVNGPRAREAREEQTERERKRERGSLTYNALRRDSVSTYYGSFVKSSRLWSCQGQVVRVTSVHSKVCMPRFTGFGIYTYVCAKSSLRDRSISVYTHIHTHIHRTIHTHILPARTSYTRSVIRLDSRSHRQYRERKRDKILHVSPSAL